MASPTGGAEGPGGIAGVAGVRGRRASLTRLDGIGMLTIMRTTVIIDDALARKARERAAAAGVSLSEIINRALRDSLHAPPRGETRPFHMVTFGGEETVSHEPAELFRLDLDEPDTVG